VQPLALAYLRLIVLHHIFTLYRLQIIQQQLGQLSPLAEADTDDDVVLWYLLWGARYTGQEYDPETGSTITTHAILTRSWGCSRRWIRN
jgi:hypothetical protein